MAVNRFLFLAFTLFTSTCFAQQESDETQLKNLIQNSFDDIFSSLDKKSVNKYYTDDFLLLEAGEIWTIDSVNNYLDEAAKRLDRPKRVNSFDFIKIEIKGKRAWVAYQNYADFLRDNISVFKLHWLESGSAIKTKEGWKLELLHSTRVED